ncbi:(Fe-S)-binding protein [Ancylobacter sp. MQZ15Z-1]|uniref:(Fe-S)-binding protein n=1 Tax=Ancylobacter mangrovi TaxID=2972472 RepID=A0A9X2T7M4_9HYPH|nr:(Fe-S)-binding protein [Ancylobacter mangrovi]MCS0497619.1 (Fe-S)-binding protein [Ancylobacter mangrovi]
MTEAAFSLSLAILALAAIAAVMAGGRARLWRAGRPAKVDWMRGLMALPKRYLVDVHHVVGRDPYAARMHALAAGGLLGGSALALLALLPPLGGSRLFWALVALAFAVALAGGFMVGRRRYPERPARLSGGKFQRLPFLLAAYAGGAFLVALDAALAGSVWPLAWPGLWLAAAGGLGLAMQLDRGPMRHAFAGALHLVAHPRAARFEGRRETALAPLNLEAPRLGVATPADFAWNRLAGFDACIQCGRCEVACPAFAAGQPLNPKRLIQDLATSMVPGATNVAYAGSPYPHAREVAGIGGPDLPIVGAGAMIHPDTLWSCTTCRACVEECPMMIEHVDAIVALRRFQTLELGALPEKAAAPLAELRYADEPQGRPLAARTDFAAGLDLPLISARAGAEVLLWLGEGAYDLRYGRTLRALVRLLHLAGVDFAVLGEEERDCGDIARRLGDEATFQRLARANIATLARHSFRRILTPDPHALHVLRNEYPALGGIYEVVHHSAFLDELVAEGRLGVAPLKASVTYHDPCYLGRYNGEIDAPRRLLDRLGLARLEMERSGRRSMCCGGGGGAPLSDIEGERRIPDIRMDQAAQTGAGIVAVACPQCTAMLEGVTGTRPEVRDIAELVLEAVEAMPARAREPAT